MFRMFFIYIFTDQPMSEVQSYYFGDRPVPIDDYYARIEYSLSEFDIESDDIVRHPYHLYRCLVYACYDAPQLPVNSLNNLMTYHLSHPLCHGVSPHHVDMYVPPWYLTSSTCAYADRKSVV